MKKTHNLFILFFALVAGFVGGQLGHISQPLLATTDSISHKEIITQTLKIVNSKNKTRALLTEQPNGIIGLTLSDSDENPRCLITVDSSGATAVSLVDARKKIRCMMSASENGQPLISLNDNNQNIKLGIVIDQDNSPCLELYGVNGLQCGELLVNKYGPKLAMASPNGSKSVLAISPDGSPGLHFLDRKGVLRSSLLVSKDDSPSLELFDSNGQQRGGFSIDPDGMTRLGLFDPVRNKMRGVFGMDSNGFSRLVFVDENGKALASFP